MFYLYYDDEGNITCVTNMIDDSFGSNYIDIDLQTYEDFSNSTKQIFDYIVIKNSKITDATVHIMNKFSLNSFIDKEFINE